MAKTKTVVASEIDTAYARLTDQQQEQVKAMHAKGITHGSIAAHLGLTKSYVHSYVRFLNGGGK